MLLLVNLFGMPPLVAHEGAAPGGFTRSQPQILYLRYGEEESYAWFVPHDFLPAYLNTELPDHERRRLLTRLERACDYQRVEPFESDLCFRPSEAPETESELWERTRNTVRSHGLSADRERQFLDHLERRYREGKKSDLAQGFRTNPCDGTGAQPTPDASRLLAQAFSPDGQRGKPLIFFGVVTEVTAGWNPTASQWATAVEVAMEQIVRRPRGISLPDRVVYLEPRARFEAGNLKICADPDEGAMSAVGMSVLVFSDSWSADGLVLPRALVFQLESESLTRELSYGGRLAPDRSVWQLLDLITEHWTTDH